MNFDLSKTTGRETYNLLIGLVNPRPIALITSMDPDGKLNAAPFSAFNYVGTDPAIVAIGVGNRPGLGVVGKDTAQNIRKTKEFVVNIVSEEIAAQMNVCAIDFPPGISELEEAGFTTEPSTMVAVPRIVQSPASLECKEYATIEIGNSRVILGLVLAINVRDDLIDPAGPYVRADRLHTIGRMNGLGNYVRTQDAFFRMDRISVKEWEEGKNRTTK